VAPSRKPTETLKRRQAATGHVQLDAQLVEVGSARPGSRRSTRRKSPSSPLGLGDHQRAPRVALVLRCVPIATYVAATQLMSRRVTGR
jgi:hypothetical protein